MPQRDSMRAQAQFSMVPTWVLERCSSVAVHVYGYLMKFANQKERRAWPKIPLLAAQMNKSVRTVERAIAELRAAGAVQTSRRHGRNGAVLGLEFLLVFVDPMGASLPATDGGKDEGESPADHSAIRGGMVSSLPANGVGTIPPPVAELKRELDPENQIQEQRDERTADPACRSHSPAPNRDDVCDVFRDAWNQAITLPLRPCHTLTPTRRRHIRAALVQFPLETWRDIFARVNRSSFLRGGKGWLATFDWLIATVDAPVKVLEGQYDDIERPPSAEELKKANDLMRAWGWCRHEPRCENSADCLRRVIRRLRGEAA